MEQKILIPNLGICCIILSCIDFIEYPTFSLHWKRKKSNCVSFYLLNIHTTLLFQFYSDENFEEESMGGILLSRLLAIK